MISEELRGWLEVRRRAILMELADIENTLGIPRTKPPTHQQVAPDNPPRLAKSVDSPEILPFTKVGT